jgi:hypothetical protein
MSLNELLRTHGFFKHPFDSWIAEEEDMFNEWFVPPPFLNTTLGYGRRKHSPLHPRSHVILGKVGSGKTALRKRIEDELAKRAANALVFRYVDFTNPLASSDRPSLATHIEEILRLGTIELIGFWHQSPDRYSHLNLMEKAELAGLAHHYYENLPTDTKRIYTNSLSPIAGRLSQFTKVSRQALIEAYNTTISVLRKEKIEPTKWDTTSLSDMEKKNPHLRIQRFWQLAKAFGVESVWILIDGVDESPGVTRGDAIFNCVAELLLSQRIMEFRDSEQQVLCFKVFLTRPEYLIGYLDKAGFRKDRIKTDIIEWNRADMKWALRRRLGYYSNHQVIDFDQICDQDAQGTHDKLLDNCGLRPRTLFRMAHEIFTEFERKNRSGVTLIDRDSVDVGCQKGLESVIG